MSICMCVYTYITIHVCDIYIYTYMNTYGTNTCLFLCVILLQDSPSAHVCILCVYNIHKPAIKTYVRGLTLVDIL